HEIDQQQRESLASNLLRRTLGILKSSSCVDDILLVSRDARVRSIAKMEDLLFLQEQGIDLNQALEQATRWSIDQRYSSILILPLDIPFLTKEDIRSTIKMASGKAEVIVIAPDHEMKGTNALLVKPPGILQYQFGWESFYRHWQQTLDRHIENKIYCSTEISFDLDSPAQYRSMVQGNLPEFDLCQKP
ncbi:unnamed protein product, partial [marine sediment metagenome]